jgi:hypothetical protein
MPKISIESAVKVVSTHAALAQDEQAAMRRSIMRIEETPGKVQTLGAMLDSAVPL